MNEEKYPYVRNGIMYIGRVRAGSKIIDYKGEMVVVHPEEKPMVITIKGLIPIEIEEAS